MGIFEFLKPKAKIVDLELEEIDPYLDKLWTDIKMKDRAREYLDQLGRQKSLLELSLNRLDSAWLQNDNIPPKEKTIMQGNKSAYILRAQRFMNELQIPKEDTQLEKFTSQVLHQLESLAQDTTKNVFILKQFLADSMNDVLRHLREMQTSTIKMRDALHGTNAKQIQKVREAMNAYRNMETEKSRYEDERIGMADSAIDARKALSAIQEEYDEHQKSSIVAEKIVQENKLAELKKEEDIILTDFRELISLIGRALHKHARGTQEKKVTAYTTDLASALIGDENLTIKTIMTELDLDEYEPKYTKRARARVMIDRFTTEELNELRRQILRIHKERENAEAQLKKISKQLKPELTTKLELAKTTLARAELTLQQHDSRIDKINLNEAKKAIDEALSAVNARLA